MVAHDVDDGRVRPAGVVQVGQPVAEAGPEMQQRGRGPAGHPAVPVGGAGDHALEQAQDAAHGGHVVEGGDEVHLRGAGVGEAHVDAGVDQRREEGTGTVHEVAPVPARAEHPVGAEDAERVEDLLDRPHQLEGGGVRHLQEVRHLLGAEAVLARDGATGVHRDPEDLTGERLALLDVGLEDGEVDVAVAHVAAPADERLVRRRQLGDLGQVVGDGGPGDDGVDDVVGARRLGHEEQPLPGGR